jgi:membrane protein YdbS with pleckstrin-like domain
MPGHARRKDTAVIYTVLIIVLILALVGALPTWGYSASWGYWPSSGLGVLLAVVLILLLLGRAR